MSGKRERCVGLICSPGGHLTEMLELREAFDDARSFYVSYDSSTTRALDDAYRVPNQPYNPFAFLRNLFRFASIFSKEQPDCLVSTGAEIAIPAFLVARLRGIPTLYIECGCQVRTPSVTGRVLSRVATRTLVQWPELLPAYKGRAEYVGSLIDETAP